jgi:hypothetical protein
MDFPIFVTEASRIHQAAIHDYGNAAVAFSWRASCVSDFEDFAVSVNLPM